MQLIDIDKPRYRRHLKIVMVTCIITLAVGSLSISQLLIALLPDSSGSHFHWNLLGVVLSALIVAYGLNRYRKHDFMTEVVYVWELKQALNKIHRKMPKLLAAAEQGDADALIAIHYSYAGSRLLWHLDDNTLTMDELVVKQAELDRLAERVNCHLEAADYDPQILARF